MPEEKPKTELEERVSECNAEMLDVLKKYDLQITAELRTSANAIVAVPAFKDVRSDKSKEKSKIVTK